MGHPMMRCSCQPKPDEIAEVGGVGGSACRAPRKPDEAEQSSPPQPAQLTCRNLAMRSRSDNPPAQTTPLPCAVLSAGCAESRLMAPCNAELPVR